MEFKFHNAAINALFEKKATAGLTRAALWAVGEIKRSFKPGTGAEYPRGGKIHRASAPGQPPAVDTGRLRASITHEMQTEGQRVTARVGTNVEYAKELEFGTRRIAARPFLRPILTARKAELVEQFAKGVKRG